MSITGIAIFQGRNVTSPGEFIGTNNPGIVFAGDHLIDVVRLDTGNSVRGNFGPVATSDDTIHQAQGSLSGIMLLATFGR